jgi:hypothetical protein
LLRDENARLKALLNQHGIPWHEPSTDVECQAESAFYFESILKQAKVKYIVGLTATPEQRDGHHPIIFMQCGPIRHNAPQPTNLPTQLKAWPQSLPTPEIPQDSICSFN